MRTGNKQSGVALVVVLSFFALMTIFVIELIFSTRINSRLTSNFCDKLKAEVLAHSGVRISLLRIQMYMHAVKLKKGQAIPESVINMIWQLPIPSFPWSGFDKEPEKDKSSEAAGDEKLSEAVSPSDIPAEIAEDLSTTDKWSMEKTLKLSRMEGKFYATISGEGGKININMLDGDRKRGSSPVIKEAVKKKLLKLMESKKKTDEDKRDDNSEIVDYNPTELVENITTYITKHGTTSSESMKKSVTLNDTDADQIKPKEDRLYTLRELKLVDGWTDTLYENFSQHFTVYSNMGRININTMDADLIKSLDENFTDEDVEKIIERRNKQMFDTPEEFINWVRTNTSVRDNFNKDNLMLFTTREKSFLIKAVGEYNGMEHEINVAVQLASTKDLLGNSNLNFNENENKDDTGGAGSNGNNVDNFDMMKIVYWYEE